MKSNYIMGGNIISPIKDKSIWCWQKAAWTKQTFFPFKMKIKIRHRHTSIKLWINDDFSLPTLNNQHLTWSQKAGLYNFTEVANGRNPWNIVFSYHELKIVYALLSSFHTKTHSCQMIPNKEMLLSKRTQMYVCRYEQNRVFITWVWLVR